MMAVPFARLHLLHLFVETMCRAHTEGVVFVIQMFMCELTCLTASSLSGFQALHSTLTERHAVKEGADIWFENGK